MTIISHRGNIGGPNPSRENSPDAIIKAMMRGFHVEVDVRYIDGVLWSGHDHPQYALNKTVVNEYHPRIIFHCKNVEALEYMGKLNETKDMHYFWHEKDAYTLTNRNVVWCYPGSPLPNKKTTPSVSYACVMPEHQDNPNLSLFDYVCTDYPEKYV